MSSLGAVQDLQNPQVLVELGRRIYKVLVMKSFLCKTLVGEITTRLPPQYRIPKVFKF